MRARLAVDVAGRGHPLVLLHGLATDRHIWDMVVPELSREGRVVTVDLPGFGESEAVGPGYELGAVADRIARGIAARGVRGPFDLVGHSLGGGVALTLAAARPRAVGRLILVAPAGFRPMPPGVTAALAASADRVLALRRRAAPLAESGWGRRLLLGFAAADGARIPPTLARQMIGASVSARRTSEALQAITSADLRPLLKQAPDRLGLIWGRADRTVGLGTLEVITRVRRDAEVAILEGAGHVPMLERPEEFVLALRRLLSS